RRQLRVPLAARTRADDAGVGAARQSRAVLRMRARARAGGSLRVVLVHARVLRATRWRRRGPRPIAIRRRTASADTRALAPGRPGGSRRFRPVRCAVGGIRSAARGTRRDARGGRRPPLQPPPPPPRLPPDADASPPPPAVPPP